MSAVILCVEIICLLCCAAFFSGAETAVTALSRAEYRSLKQKPYKNAQRLASLVEIKDKIVTTALIGTNFVNTLNSSLITAFTLSAFGPQGVPAATALITVLIIIVAEIFPKALATERPAAFGKTASLPLYLCYLLLRPAAAFFSLLSKAVLNILSSSSHDAPALLQKKDLQLLIHIGQEDGALAAGEEALLRKAVLLQSVKLRNIMTPRTGIVYIEEADTFDAIIAKFRSSRFSRLPVYNAEKQEVTGILHYKDILFTVRERTGIPLKTLLRPALFIPESSSVFSVIKTMKTKGQNMVILIDEHGGIAGLITMDDIIAAVFSYVQDEYSSEKIHPISAVRLINTTQLVMPGNLRIEDCNELLHTNLYSDYYDTIGGFLLEQLGYLPQIDQTVEYKHIIFIIKKITHRKIIEVIADISKIM
ncbi:MAG: hemolysin family protein [Treponema sp.]